MTNADEAALAGLLGKRYSLAEPRRPAAMTHLFLFGKPRHDGRNSEMRSVYSLPVSVDVLGLGLRSYHSPPSSEAR